MWDKKWISITNSVLSAITLMLFVSMRTMTGFIGAAINFHALPYILTAILAVLVVLSFIDTLGKHNKKLTITLSVFNLVAFVASFGYFIAMIPHYRVFVIEMVKILGIYAIIAIVVYLIFYFPKSKIYTKTIATIVCVILVVGIIIGFTNVKSLQFNYFTDGAVVYAVENEYQIVFTTHSKGTAWVEIDGVKYYDEKAGSIVDNQTVHKVSVPQGALDKAKAYTIGSKAIIDEEAFIAWRGRTITKNFTFRPINEEDGIQYYTVSDTHDNNKRGVKSSQYFGENTDFVVIAGDAVSFLETTTDLRRVLSLGYGMTKGNIPVVFARGNHELKGKLATQLYRYVGCNKNGDFYYTFNLGSIWGLVLDFGEDHADDWYEFFGTANFTDYRNKQLDFVKDIIANKDNTYLKKGITHRIAISHISPAFVQWKDTYVYEYFIDLNMQLNQMSLDAMLNGHVHEAYVLPKGKLAGDHLIYQEGYTGKVNGKSEPDYLATGATYDTIICGRSSVYQLLSHKEKKLGASYLGTALEFKVEKGDGILAVRFTTNKKKIVETISPFENGVKYGGVIYLS